MNQAVATVPSAAVLTLTRALAARFNMDGADRELVDTLKATAFKSQEPVSDAQLTALLIIAQEYGLNPFTKEIYAYPDKYKGITPVVGVDGWIRIVNEHPAFDGIEFDVDPSFVTCSIYRKDRTRPTTISEYLEECKRETDPWKKMPKRMLRHKALMQCARVAFGFALHDEEEGAEIAAAGGTVIDAESGEVIEQAKRGPQRKSAGNPPPPASKRDDTPETGEVAPPPAATSAPTPPASSATGRISENQAKYLRKKLADAGASEQETCERYGVERLEDLTVDAFDERRAELLAG